MGPGTDRLATLRLLYVGEREPGVDTFAAAFPDVTVEVHTVAGAAAALERLDEVDCVVSEYRLADGDGLTLLGEVRDRRPELPFVLFPADGSEQLAGRAIELDVTEYVPNTGTDAVGRMVERTRAAVQRATTADGGVIDVGRPLGETVKERAMDEAPVGITISDPSLPDNPLVYVNDRFVDVLGYPEEEVVGRNCRFLQGPESDPEAVRQMREAIDAEEPVSVELVNYRKDGSTFWNKVDIAPIRNEADEVTHFVGFQTDITKRKEAELAAERRAVEVQQERQNLEHLLDRVNGLVQDVTAAVVRANSREELATAVCERMVEADPYRLAWVGTPDLGSDRITPGAWAGTSDSDVEALSIDTGSDDPAARALSTGELQAVGDLETAPAAAAHADLLSGTGSMAAVPLTYRDTTYGVLCVYTTWVEAINDREEVVLGALGRSAATAINAIESRRMLAADNVVEIDFESADPELFFVAISGWTGADLEFNGSVYRDDGSLLVFFTVEGASAEDVLTVAAECEGVLAADCITEREDDALFEFVVPEDALVAWLAERGVETRAIEVSEGVARVSIDVLQGADARSVFESLRERYPGTELVAYHERQRPARTRQEFTADIEDRLTGKQLTALRKAYLGGYFDHSRRITGDELAGSMDISRSTYHQHLRAAQRKLIGEFLEGEVG